MLYLKEFMDQCDELNKEHHKKNEILKKVNIDDVLAILSKIDDKYVKNMQVFDDVEGNQTHFHISINRDALKAQLKHVFINAEWPGINR